MGAIFIANGKGKKEKNCDETNQTNCINSSPFTMYFLSGKFQAEDIIRLMLMIIPKLLYKVALELK